MDAIKTLIKQYVTLIDSAIPSDSYLDFVVSEVIDRALIYMNRDGLVTQYESDILDVTVLPTSYIYPIPLNLQRPLASVAVGSYKTLKTRNTNGTNFGVKSVSDNGQSITYTDGVATYFISITDAEIFGGVTTLLDRYKRPKIPNADTNYAQTDYWGRFL